MQVCVQNGVLGKIVTPDQRLEHLLGLLHEVENELFEVVHGRVLDLIWPQHSQRDQLVELLVMTIHEHRSFTLYWLQSI